MKRTPFLLLAAVLLAALSACSVGGRLRPGIGASTKVDATGARMGIDLGEYDLGGAANDPRTGQAPGDACPGGVCTVPTVPPFRVEVSPKGLVPDWLWPVVFILGALAAALLGFKVWRAVSPKTAPAAPAKVS